MNSKENTSPDKDELITDGSLGKDEENLLKSICHALKEGEKKNAFIQHEKDLPSQLKGLWEGYHILEYAKKIEYENGGKKANEAFQKHVNKEFKYISNLPHLITVSLCRCSSIFLALADAQGVKQFDCLLDFLIFCNDKKKPRPLSYFSVQNTDLDINNVIVKMQKHQKKACNNKTEEIQSQVIDDETIVQDTKIVECEKFIENNFDTPNNENINTISTKPSSTLGFTRNLNLEPPPAIDSFSYYGKQTIDIIGRDDEKDKLWAFLNGTKSEDTKAKDFAWFQLAGVAGQGKSRLALDLVNKAQELEWEAGLLEEKEFKKMAEHWEEWQPQKPHLIVVDYVVGRLDELRTCFRCLCYRQEAFHHPVRLLLLERQPWNRGYSMAFSQNSNSSNSPSSGIAQSCAEWFSYLSERGDGHDNYIARTRYDTGVLELKKMTPDMLVKIVKQIASHASRELTLSNERIKEQLHAIDKEGRPLYAYFLGKELSYETGIKGWSRNDLLTAALNRERNWWWKCLFQKEPPYLDEESEASHLALLATIIGGLDYNKATRAKLLPKVESKERREALILTGGALEKHMFALDYIPAMQPDLLGEWYVTVSYKQGYPMELLFSTAWQYAPDKVAGFLLKLIQDFPEEPIIDAILEGMNFEKIDTLTIADTVNGCLSEYSSKGKTLPNKLIDILQINVSKKHAPSLRQSGWLHFYGIGVEKDTSEAVRLYQEAAESGDVSVKINLGWCYQNGEGVEKDTSEAVRLYREATESGDATAKLNLGICYQTGEGVEKDTSEAVRLYREAAESGEASAKLNLGICYQTGEGVEKDTSEAVRLYREAAESGDARAKLNLGVCYQTGKCVEKDTSEAVRLYREAAESGNASAKFNLGWCYQNGEGVEKDTSEAVRLYREAAESGNASAKLNLGVCYQTGEGVEKDTSEAVRLYREAAESGDATAKLNLSICYQTGEGIEKDTSEAVRLYREAAEMGEQATQSKLTSLPFALNLLEECDCANTLDRNWAELQITNLSSEKWHTMPLKIGHWEQPPLKNTIQILTDFHRGLRLAEQHDQLSNTQCVRIRMTSLCFYPELSLIEIELLSLENNISLFTHALYSSNGVTPLNGNSSIIYTLNPKFLSFKAERAPVEYLIFFCKFVHADKGAFHIISNLNDPVFTMKLKEMLPETIKQSFFSVRHVNGVMETDGWQCFEACMIYGKDFYRSTFKLFADGAVNMESSDIVEENLTVTRYHYDGIFCYLPSDD